jgi:hypothetical protein
LVVRIKLANGRNHNRALLLSRRLHHTGFVVGGLVYPPAHRISLRSIGRVGLQQSREGFLLIEVGIEPQPVVLGVEDDWHTVVDLTHEIVCIGSDNGARTDLFSVLPGLP